MSNFQIGLAVAGGLVLAAVVAYNTWTTRRNAPRQAELAEQVEPSGLDPVEPTFTDAELAVRDMALPTPHKKPMLDALIDVIANLADCDGLFVHATVDQRIFNELSPGDAAQFRFHDGQVVPVMVTLRAGTGPRTLFDTLAVSPTREQTEGYAVLLEGAGLMANGQCPIGETGRVVFSEGPLGAIGDFIGALGL